jgi:branched-chain amino acid aminotransferase/4-amino-4-deoxychorismate lyase
MIYNFEEVTVNKNVLNLQNRAFLYGDGLFETMICENGKIYFLKDHWLRLTEGCKVLKMILPDQLRPEYLTELVADTTDDLRIRLQVWRKPGGLYTPQNNEAECCITIQPFVSVSNPVKEKVIFITEPILHFSGLSRFKTCNSLPYVMAGIAKNEANVDDVILNDVFGNIAECSSSNIFWMKDNQLFTPHLQTGCIDGIMRKQVLLEASNSGITVTEGFFKKEDLIKNVTFAFTTNVTGIYQIKQIEDFRPEADNLPEWLRKLHKS